MADLPAAEGSFEWAMLELKSGKRVSREAWKDRNIYLVLNPGEPGQTVKDGDWRALAGVPVDTQFDYLPNIEICNAEVNFVPYQPSQVDMEIKDWKLVQDSDKDYYLTMDITSETSTGVIVGYIDIGAGKLGDCDFISTNTPASSVGWFRIDSITEDSARFEFGVYVPNNDKELIEKTRLIFKNYYLSILVDKKEYKIDVCDSPGVAYTEKGNMPTGIYSSGTVPKDFLNELMITNIKRRYYCKWTN